MNGGVIIPPPSSYAPARIHIILLRQLVVEVFGIADLVDLFAVTQKITKSNCMDFSN